MSSISAPIAPQTLASDTLTTPAVVVTRRQLWNDVMVPFLATRVTLLVIGWLANYFPTSPDYPLQDVVARGWHFSPYRLLDIWGRWDTGWYMSIVRDGYMLQANYTQQQSNLTFFPLYPLLIRLLLWPIPQSWQTDGIILLAGVIVSNLCLLAALVLLYLLVQELTHDAGVAQRSILYLLFFPTAFYFSCVYTESTFLLLSVAALYAAQRRQWAWAALAAALLGITRPLGVLIAPILFWIYLSAAGWRIRNIRANVLWLLLVPLPFLLYLAWMWQTTGDWLTPLNAQQPFFRGYAWPWITVLMSNNATPFITPLEQFFIVFFLVLALVACWRLPSAAYGLWVLALIVPFLFTGTTSASLRYLLMAVPAFIIMALWGKISLLDRLFQTLFFALQIVLMIAWCQFYFIS